MKEDQVGDPFFSLLSKMWKALVFVPGIHKVIYQNQEKPQVKFLMFLLQKLRRKRGRIPMNKHFLGLSNSSGFEL